MHGFTAKNWATSWENLSSAMCEQQRHWSACASVQSDQCLCCLLLSIIINFAVNWKANPRAACEAEQTVLSQTWSYTSEDRFSHGVAQMFSWFLELTKKISAQEGGGGEPDTKLKVLLWINSKNCHEFHDLLEHEALTLVRCSTVMILSFRTDRSF